MLQLAVPGFSRRRRNNSIRNIIKISVFHHLKQTEVGRAAVRKGILKAFEPVVCLHLHHHHLQEQRKLLHEEYPELHSSRNRVEPTS